MSPVDMDALVRAHTWLRDRRSQLKAQFERADAELQTEQSELRRHMLAHLNATNAKNMTTASGTVYRTEKFKPRAADWSAIWTWAKQTDNMEIFERRLKSTFIEQYAEQHEGNYPPGVDAFREYDVGVRRGSE